MPEIVPFRGIRFHECTTNVIAPPYDVISKEYRLKLMQLNPFNITHVILPNSYEKAYEYVHEWLEDDILCLDKECSFYGYTGEYYNNGHKKIMSGFLAALKLEAFGGNIKPHEKTLHAPKIDRFNLIMKTNTMFCPIMAFYSDESLQIQAVLNRYFKDDHCLIDVNFENINHKIYKIAMNSDIEIIKSILHNKIVTIADGHHRYETGLMMKEHFNKMGFYNGGFNYILCFFTEQKTGGLLLNAIHRVVKNVGNFDYFVKRIYSNFEEVAIDASYDFILYRKGNFRPFRFRGNKSSNPLHKLTSTIVEEYIFKDILGVSDDDIVNGDIIGYAHSKEELIKIVDSGYADVGFILHSIDYDDFFDIIDSNIMVPQKSTYFSPKLPSGLIGYHLLESIKGC